MFQNVESSEYSQCDLCGAMVVNETLHEIWHNQSGVIKAEFIKPCEHGIIPSLNCACRSCHPWLFNNTSLKIITGNSRGGKTAQLESERDAMAARGLDTVIVTGRGVDMLLNPLCKCGHGITDHVEGYGVRLACRRTPSGVRCKCSCFKAI